MLGSHIARLRIEASAETLGRLLAVLTLLVLALCSIFFAERASAAPCDPPIANAIVCENSKPGNPPSEWDVSGAGDSNIQGFATDISVDQGQTVRFKIDTPSSDYRLDIYRMGYYGGNGARKVATVQPSAALPQTQPACLTESTTGLIDCGNWARVGLLDGAHRRRLRHLLRQARARGRQPRAVVTSSSSSATTTGTPTSSSRPLTPPGRPTTATAATASTRARPATNPGRAYKVSYNRPLTVRGTTPEDSPFNAEYPMVRWLERNGYDVSYSTGVDTDRRGAEILEHKAFLSVGHDEYWSGDPARERRGGPRSRRQPRLLQRQRESSGRRVGRTASTAPNVDHRTLVSYKETHANAKIDPTSTWTGTWRDPRFSPPADGGRPENALTGTIFMVNSGTTAIKVPAADGKMRFWRNTNIASLAPGQTATLSANTLGYEWDEELDNGFRPAGLIDLSSTTDKRAPEAPRPGLQLRPRHRDPPPDPLPRSQRRPGLRGRHHPVVLGVGRNPRPRRLDRRMRGCSRPRSTCWPTWACSPAPCRPVWRR